MDSTTIALLVVFAVLVVSVHGAASQPAARPGLTYGVSCCAEGTGKNSMAVRPSRSAPGVCVDARLGVCVGRFARGRADRRRRRRRPRRRPSRRRTKRWRRALARLAVRPSAETHKAVGREYRRLGLLEQAFDQFGAATHLDRRDAEAYDARARIWRDWGFPGRGMGDAARAVYYAPQSASAHNTWGTLLAASGLLATRRSEFDRARALDPAAAYAVTNLVLCRLRRRRDQPARSPTAGRALDLDSGSVIAGNNLRSAWPRPGSWTPPKNSSCSGDRMTGRYNAGLAYLAAGRFGEASAAFEAVSAGRIPWRSLRAFARTRRGHCRRAHGRCRPGAMSGDADQGPRANGLLWCSSCSWSAPGM